ACGRTGIERDGGELRRDLVQQSPHCPSTCLLVARQRERRVDEPIAQVRERLATKEARRGHVSSGEPLHSPAEVEVVEDPVGRPRARLCREFANELGGDAPRLEAAEDLVPKACACRTGRPGGL